MLKSRVAVIALAVVLSAVAAPAQEKQNPDSEKHTFRVETDSGRYGLTAERLDPKRLGVAIYPGAQVLREGENDHSGGNITFEWGKESTRLFVQKYASSDPAEKVIAFYRKQLSKYGPVVECRDGKPLAPVKSELTCGEGGVKYESSHSDGFELKAGSKHSQHIVGVTPKGASTEFGIVFLEQSKRGEL